MTDAHDVAKEPEGKQGTSAPAKTPQQVRTIRVKKKASIWSDPVTRVLGVILAVILVGGLLTVVVALVNGAIDLSGAPQSSVDRDLNAAEEALGEGDDPDAWQDYISALIAADRISEARAELKRAEGANLDLIKGQNILYLQAFLEAHEGNTDKAIELYNEVATKTSEAYQKELTEGPETQNWAIALGKPHQNYENSLLHLADLYSQKKEWEKAQTTLDTYLQLNPVEAGVYIDRGKIKVELGDYVGARKDFKMALKYMPNDPEATEALNDIEGK